MLVSVLVVLRCELHMLTLTNVHRLRVVPVEAEDDNVQMIPVVLR